MKPRIAILISGGGSNMISLVKSINANKINAVITIAIAVFFNPVLYSFIHSPLLYYNNYIIH